MLDHLVDLEGLSKLSDLDHADPATVHGLLEEYGRFTAEVFAPLDAPGDEQGSRYDPSSGAVATPDGWPDAYQRYVAGGWGSVPFDPEHGGGGFPWLVAVAMQELMISASMSFSLVQLLTQGAIEMLTAWGGEEHEIFLQRMISGEWAGTMNLTEPEAGSDVGALRTKAVPGRRRDLAHQGPEDLHHLRRARSHRPDRPPRPGPHPRRRSRHQGHLVLHRPQVPRRRRRLARRAQRRQVRVDRAQDGDPRQPDLRDGLRGRQRRSRRLPDRRGQRRHALHVHDDEQRPALGRAAGSRRGRAGVPGGAGPGPGTAPGPQARDRGRTRPSPSSSTPTCGACC